MIIGAENSATGTPDLDAYTAAHLQDLAELASRSKQGSFTWATDSGHAVPTDRPDLINTTVEEVVAAVR